MVLFPVYHTITLIFPMAKMTLKVVFCTFQRQSLYFQIGAGLVSNIQGEISLVQDNALVMNYSSNTHEDIYQSEISLSI